MLLTEKYRPRSISDFVGLDKPKRLCERIAANPFASSYLFIGAPGLGKSTMALALADAIPAELHHIPSQDCTVERLRKVVADCQYVPRIGCRAHMILVEEADKMSAAAQLFCLSKTDETDRPADTIFIFTANSDEGLEPRFLSRCMRVDFSAYGNSNDAAGLLQRVWDTEAPRGAEPPNFARIVKEATGNVRASLMRLQNELLLA